MGDLGGEHMRNTLQDLNNALFQQIEALQDDEAMNDPSAFDKEIKRSQAITGISAQILQLGSLRLKAARYAEEYCSGDATKVRALIGESGE